MYRLPMHRPLRVFRRPIARIARHVIPSLLMNLPFFKMTRYLLTGYGLNPLLM